MTGSALTIGEFTHSVFLEQTPEASTTPLTNEYSGIPEDDFEVPNGQVFFEVQSQGTNYSNEPWQSTIIGTPGNSKVSGTNSRNADRFRYHSSEGFLLGPGETQEVVTYLFGIPVITLITNNEGIGEELIGRELPEDLVAKAISLERAFTRSSDFPDSHEVMQRFIVEQQIRWHLESGDDHTSERQFQSAMRPYITRYPGSIPNVIRYERPQSGTFAQQTPEILERQSREICGFVNGNFDYSPDSVLTMPSSIFSGGIDQTQWLRTSDGGTIELQRTFRRESDENPTDWYINIYGPDVEGFHPALRAYLAYSEGSIRPAGGFAKPEYPDGAFDQFRIDEVLQFAYGIAADTPIPSDEALSLTEYRKQVALQMQHEMKPFLGGSSAEFQKFRQNYAARRTVAINRDAGTIPVLRPVEQDLNVVQIPLVEVTAAMTSVDGIDDSELSTRINEILAGHRDNAWAAHLLTWNGGMVPRGAVVGGHEIAGMQHGQVVALDGSTIGTYERVITPSANNLRNEVVVFLTMAQS